MGNEAIQVLNLHEAVAHHLQPLFAGAPFFAHAPGQDVAANLFDSGICLPSGSNLSDSQIDQVVDQLRRALSFAEGQCASA